MQSDRDTRVEVLLTGRVVCVFLLEAPRGRLLNVARSLVYILVYIRIDITTLLQSRWSSKRLPVSSGMPTTKATGVT
jgi:hypothetical protein